MSENSWTRMPWLRKAAAAKCPNLLIKNYLISEFLCKSSGTFCCCVSRRIQWQRRVGARILEISIRDIDKNPENEITNARENGAPVYLRRLDNRQIVHLRIPGSHSSSQSCKRTVESIDFSSPESEFTGRSKRHSIQKKFFELFGVFSFRYFEHFLASRLILRTFVKRHAPLSDLLTLSHRSHSSSLEFSSAFMTSLSSSLALFAADI